MPGTEITQHPDLLVGIDGSDDAAVYRISDDLALVQTVDFFTPIVDDPRTWGRIAAANALSDVYAMGGTPLTALQLLSWPRDELPWSVAADVIDGAVETLTEAGCTLVGGHSIDDTTPKFGFAITGTVHPDKMITNAAAQPGCDRLDGPAERFRLEGCDQRRRPGRDRRHRVRPARTSRRNASRKQRFSRTRHIGGSAVWGGGSSPGRYPWPVMPP